MTFSSVCGALCVACAACCVAACLGLLVLGVLALLG